MRKYSNMSDDELWQAGRQILIDVARKAAQDDASMLCWPAPNGEMAALDFEMGMGDLDSFDSCLDDSEWDDVIAAAYGNNRGGDIFDRLYDTESAAREWSLSLVLSVIGKTNDQ